MVGIPTIRIIDSSPNKIINKCINKKRDNTCMYGKVCSCKKADIFSHLSNSREPLLQ